jgi:hypothetical protein
LNFPTEKIIKSDQCISPELAVAFALKAEEFFPEKKYRDIAIALYQKMKKCSSPFTKAILHFF